MIWPFLFVLTPIPRAFRSVGADRQGICQLQRDVTAMLRRELFVFTLYWNFPFGVDLGAPGKAAVTVTPYCFSVPASPPGPFRFRTRATGSISRRRAAVQRAGVASG